MRRIEACERGVTLVELLLGLAISAMVMVPVVAMLGTGVAAGAHGATRLTLEQDASFALERIAAQVRATPRKKLDPNASVSDSDKWFGPVRFSMKADQLIERRGAADHVLADAVRQFSITATAVGDDTTLVEARLDLERGAETASATTVVRMGGPR